MWVTRPDLAARQVKPEIPIADVTPGALILFRMRTGAVAKHCGIVTAPTASCTPTSEPA
jgi:hypothetical protein